MIIFFAVGFDKGADKQRALSRLIRQSIVHNRWSTAGVKIRNTHPAEWLLGSVKIVIAHGAVVDTTFLIGRVCLAGETAMLSGLMLRQEICVNIWLLVGSLLTET